MASQKVAPALTMHLRVYEPARCTCTRTDFRVRTATGNVGRQKSPRCVWGVCKNVPSIIVSDQNAKPSVKIKRMFFVPLDREQKKSGRIICDLCVLYVPRHACPFARSLEYNTHV